MLSLFKKKVPAEEAGFVLADFVRRRMHDKSPLPALVSDLLSAGGIDRAAYDREDVLLSLFCGEVVVRTTVPDAAQGTVLDFYFSAVDSLCQSDNQYLALRPQVQGRLQAYRHALSTTDTSPDTMMAVGCAFAKFCTGEGRFNLAMIADLSFKAQLQARSEFFRSVKIDVTKVNDDRRFMLDMIRQNADRIQQTERRTRKDAEYLAICVLLDDLASRQHGAQGRRVVMDILTKEHHEHHNDVLTYLAINSGAIKLKPDAEQKWIERHQMRPK